MRIPKHFSQSFTDRVRSRGQQYFLDDRVRLVELSADLVSAQVQGSEPYSVQAVRSGNKLVVECNCRYFEETDFCKHIWATLLMVAAEGGEGYWVGLSELEDGFVGDGLDDWDDDDDDALDSHPALSNHSVSTEGGHVLLVDDDGISLKVPPQRAAVMLSTGRYRRVEDRTQLTSLLVKQRWERTLRNLSHQSDPRLSRAPTLDADERLPYYFLELGSLSAQDDRPLVTAWLRSRKKSGGWALPRPLKIKDVSMITDVEHRTVLALIMAAGVTIYRHHDLRSRDGLAAELDHETLDVTLPALCRTGRLRYAPPNPDYTPLRALKHQLAALLETQPLRLDEGAPWQFRLRLRPRLPQEAPLAGHQMERLVSVLEGDQPDGPPFMLDGELVRHDEIVALREPARLYENGWVLFEDRIAPLKHADSFAWISAMRPGGGLCFPGDSLAEILRELTSLPVMPALELDEACGVITEQGDPRPALILEHPGRGTTLHAVPSFLYGNTLIDARASDPGALSEDGARFLRRNPDAETRHLEKLVEVGIHPLGPRQRARPRCTHGLDARELPAAVTALLAEGWHVEVEGRQYRSAGELRFSVRTDIDWFDLKTEVAFEGGSAGLPAVLKALQTGTRELVLDDGSVGLLPEEWLRQLGLLAGLGTARGGTLRFRRSQVALLDLMLAARPEVDVDQRFAEIRGELRAFETVEPRREGRGFSGTLRGYQREGLGWLAFLRRFGLGGCLADDMGLGKTVEALAALWERRGRGGGEGEAEEHRPSLVVAPKSVVWNWVAEAARFTPSLRVYEHTGSGRSRDRTALVNADLVVTTYGILRRDAALLSDVEFDYAILDEAQAIKNARTVTAKAARLLRARHRLALSGTPIENHLGELWSLFEFLNPGMLGRSSAFGHAPDGHDLDDASRRLLNRAMRPYILRRTKAQVATELPERTEQILRCDLSSDQRLIYDDLREHYRQSLLSRRNGGGDRHFEGSKVHVLEALLRLRQAACHPGLVDPADHGESPSAKLDLLVDHLTDRIRAGHKALVFSQFTKLLKLLKVRLDDVGLTYEYLDGRTRKREPKIRRFQEDPDLPLFLISLKAGGLGLNLTAADYVFLLDPWWNPAVEAQAIDRAHRIGQTRPVMAYRLIARDTVEEKVLELQERKRDLADAIISGDNRLLRNLSVEDLELLLG